MSSKSTFTELAERAPGAAVKQRLVPMLMSCPASLFSSPFCPAVLSQPAGVLRSSSAAIINSVTSPLVAQTAATYSSTTKYLRQCQQSSSQLR